MSISSWTTRTASPEATAALAERLGAMLRPGQGLAVLGEMGAGKTVFVRGLARGLRVDDPDEVRSPTYLMLVEHPGPIPLYHVDAYFAGKGVRLAEEGGLLAMAAEGVVAVEWPQRLPSAIPDDWLRVTLRAISPEEREISLSGAEPEWGVVLRELGS